LNRLKEYYRSDQLAKLLPQSKKQIETLANLKMPTELSAAKQQPLLKTLVFFVTEEQLGIIGRALSIAVEKVSDGTVAQKKAIALAMIAHEYQMEDRV
jgi:hypothetical protein